MSKKTGGLSRRNFILTSSAASAGLLRRVMPQPCSHLHLIHLAPLHT